MEKDDLYDVLDEDGGVERALAKLDTIKDEIVWWSAGAETPQLLADGEVVIGSTHNGGLFSVIPAGLPEEREAAVMDFVKYATDTQRLADQAKYISYGPARASSQPLVGKHVELGIEMAPHMPTNPANAERFLMNNLDWWADNQDDAEAKFQAWIVQ